MKLTDKIKEFGYSMKSHAGKIIVGGIILAETVLIGLQQDEKYRLEQELNSYKNEMRSKSEYVIDAIKPIYDSTNVKMWALLRKCDQRFLAVMDQAEKIANMHGINMYYVGTDSILSKNPIYQKLVQKEQAALKEYYKASTERDRIISIMDSTDAIKQIAQYGRYDPYDLGKRSY